jgi:hypothetical protein
MIHLEDLCRIVKAIAMNDQQFINKNGKNRMGYPKSRYYFALDNGKITQL